MDAAGQLRYRCTDSPAVVFPLPWFSLSLKRQPIVSQIQMHAVMQNVQMKAKTTTKDLALLKIVKEYHYLVHSTQVLLWVALKKGCVRKKVNKLKSTSSDWENGTNLQ